MEKLLLIGAGGFGRVVLEHAEKEYLCAFLDDGIAPGTSVDGSPVLGPVSSMHALYGEYRLLVVAIGNNGLREKIYREARRIGYSFPNIVVPSAYISPHASVGTGCVILNNVCIQNASSVGDGVILNPGVEVHHGSRVGNYALIYTNSVIRTFARVGDRAWIGSTLTIGNSVGIPDDAIVENGRTVS